MRVGKAAKKFREYELTVSALDRWITQFQTSGSFKVKDNRSLEVQALKEKIRTIFNNNRKYTAHVKLKVPFQKQVTPFSGLHK